MKFLLVHCWGGDGRSCWSGWLSDQLQVLGFEVLTPDLPNTNTPDLGDWLAAIRSHVKRFDEKEEWVLVGHSLGCATILHLLETFDETEKLYAVILVAGFAKDLGIPEIRNFLDKEFDWEKINKKCDKFIVINSDNDPYTKLSEGERLARLLNTKLIIEHGAGHINEGSGYTKYKRLLSILIQLKKFQRTAVL